MRLLIRRHTDTISQLVLFLHNRHRQTQSDTREDEHSPLPTERIDGDAEREPPYQLAVREEVKRARRAARLDELGHVDPALHPVRRGPRQGVEEEHQ